MGGWFEDDPFDERVCRVCGCDDMHACVSEAGVACHWVADDLCSACADADHSGLVQVYSEAQASAYLRARTAGGAL